MVAFYLFSPHFTITSSQYTKHEHGAARQGLVWDEHAGTETRHHPFCGCTNLARRTPKVYLKRMKYMIKTYSQRIDLVLSPTTKKSDKNTCSGEISQRNKM